MNVAPENGNGEGLLDPEQRVEEVDAPQTLWQRFQVGIVFVIFVTFRAADRVFLKSVNNELASTTYNLVWSNILWPFAIQLLTCVLLAGYVIMQRQQGNLEYNWRFFMPYNPLASTKGAMPMYVLALFSLGDQLNAAISSPASPFVSQALQSVMTNFVLIWMAMIAFFWISARFMQTHYVGMALVIMACVVQIAPSITDNDCSEEALKQDNVDCFEAYHSPLHGGQWIKLTVTQMALFYGLFLISTLPSAVSNVYKQKVLQDCDADIFYVTFWSGWWQVVWGWLCIPLMWIPLPGQETLSPADTFKAIGDTFSCIAGNVPHPPDDDTCASSPPPYIYIALYLSFNITFNLALTWLTKRISAAWAQVATVVCLNLCNIFSSMKFIMHESAQPLTLYDWLGAILVSIALWVYNLYPETTAEGKEVTQLATGSFVADGHANIVEKVSGASKSGSFTKQGSFKG